MGNIGKCSINPSRMSSFFPCSRAGNFQGWMKFGAAWDGGRWDWKKWDIKSLPTQKNLGFSGAKLLGTSSCYIPNFCSGLLALINSPDKLELSKAQHSPIFLHNSLWRTNPNETPWMCSIPLSKILFSYLKDKKLL